MTFYVMDKEIIKTYHDLIRESFLVNLLLIKYDDNDGKGSKKGYIWVIVCATTGLVYFFYDDESRSEKVILDELKGYEGVIQSDGLGAYKKVALQSDGKIVNFFDYLPNVLNKSAAMPPGSLVEVYRNLLPDKWTKNEQGQ